MIKAQPPALRDELPGTSIASVFRDRGYRTAFLTPSDLNWAAWDTFLDRRGFGDQIDYHGLPCAELLSSWGVEDRCMVDGMIERMSKALGGQASVLATGGLAPKVLPACNTAIRHEPELTLMGLRLIYERNRS